MGDHKTMPWANVLAWLDEEALRDSEAAWLYSELCQRLREAGAPLLRGHVSFRVLHPLYDSSAFNWRAHDGVVEDQIVVHRFSPADPLRREFLQGPLGHVLKHGLPMLRRRLTGKDAQLDFTVLKEFLALGGTDYLVVPMGFDEEQKEGIICSWVGDRETGFTDDEIDQLRRICRVLAVVLRAKLERSVAQNVAEVYLGSRAARAVLNGSIRRGDGERIEAALFYSDMRRSTELAERLSAEEFLHVLGDYFEMTAGAVLHQGGEVVSLIGDAVLGLFRVEDSAEEACKSAFAAAQEARRRLQAGPTGGAALEFGIALNLGHVIYGNVGVPERLQFTVVGSVVNELVRVQDLTKELNCPVLATALFAKAASGQWSSVGQHQLRGFETPAAILTPSTT
jgi:adenylate cyclase